MELNISEINKKRFKPLTKYVAVDFDDHIRYFGGISSPDLYMKKVQENDNRKCWYLGETDSEGKFYLREN